MLSTRAFRSLILALTAVIAVGLSTGTALAVPAAAPAPSGTGPGYWLFGGDGGVFPFGRGAYEGGLATRPTNAPIVAGAVTTNGLGYWMVASDGGVFAFGTAPYAGGMTGRPHAPIVGLASTPDDHGYWLVARDGGIFSFGSAKFYGSLNRVAHAPIAAIASTADGRGYWLVARDGAVYAFGDALYVGGANGVGHAPIVSLVPTGGRGYWLAATDGAVFSYGDARYLGGAGGITHAPIAGMARLPGGTGYWLAATDGGVFSFGDAGYFGGVGQARLNRGIVAIASGDGIAIPQAPAAPASTAGFDISWPQCGGIRPAPPYGFGIVGVTGGHLFSANPCLAPEWDWARTYGSFAGVYINTNSPDAAGYVAFAQGEAKKCGINAGCVLDLWGRRGVDQALRDAKGIDAPMWWLDVETGNQWLPDTAANAVVLRGMIDELQRHGRKVGIYSTAYQWGVIAGGYSPGLPTWVPGAPVGQPASYCAAHSFGGGPTWMAQSGDPNFDTDVLCAAGLNAYKVAFAPPAPLPVPRYGQPVVKAPTVFPGPPPAASKAAVVPVPAVKQQPVALPPLPKTGKAHHSLWALFLIPFAVLIIEARAVVRAIHRGPTAE